MRFRPVLALAVLVFCVNATIYDLGVLPGGTSSDAQAISNSGLIVGSADAGGWWRPVVFNVGAAPAEIPVPTGPFDAGATGVNDAGIVVGQLGTERAFVYPIGGSVFDLGAETGAFGINSFNDVAGYRVTGGRDTAQVWAGASTPVSLGHLGGGASSAEAVIDEALVCGWSSYDQSRPTGKHAFLWHDGTMHDLGALPGGAWSIAKALMANGPVDPTFANVSVVGISETAASAYHAFVWNAGVMTDLGALPGDNRSQASGINRDGTIVGYSINTAVGKPRAVIWVGGIIHDLNVLLPANSGWELETANAINDAGHVVGSGRHDGVTRAFLFMLH